MNDAEQLSQILITKFEGKSNTKELREELVETVRNYMSLLDFDVVCDETTNNPNDISQNKLNVAVKLELRNNNERR